MSGLRVELRRFVNENFVMGSGRSDFADDASFSDLEILDSSGFLELVAYLEEAYGVTVADEELSPANLDSLDKLAAFIQRKRRVL